MPIGRIETEADLQRFIEDALGRVSIESQVRGLAGEAGWHYVGATGEPPFLNAWTTNQANRKPRFRRQGGYTELYGLVLNGTAGLRAFDLPPGYRPAQSDAEPGGAAGEAYRFSVVASGGVARLSVYGFDPANPLNVGAVVPDNLGASNVAAFCFLDGVRFRHERI